MVVTKNTHMAYTVTTMLHAGEDSHVFLALQDQRAVVVRVYDRDRCRTSAEVTLRVLRERQALAWTPHPNVTRLLACHLDNGYAHHVMEYVDGSSLETTLCMHGPLSVAKARACAAGVSRGVEHVHAMGCVYRNLEPHNVRMDTTGRARLCDFGFVCARGDVSINGVGPEYMAPEILMQSAACDGTSDWWSFGCLLSEMLAGATPFAGHDTVLPLVKAVVRDPIVVPAGLDKDAAECVARLLVRDPTRRLGYDGASVRANAWFVDA